MGGHGRVGVGKSRKKEGTFVRGKLLFILGNKRKGSQKRKEHRGGIGRRRFEKKGKVKQKQALGGASV